MLIPMLLNILLITISLNWRGTPYVVSFFLLQLACLIWFESPKLIHLLSGKLAFEQKDLQEKSLWGTLTWLGGLFLIYCGVFISHQFGLTPAYIIVIIGLTKGISSYKLDGTKQVE